MASLKRSDCNKKCQQRVDFFADTGLSDDRNFFKTFSYYIPSVPKV